jgi:hypothetical protein
MMGGGTFGQIFYRVKQLWQPETNSRGEYKALEVEYMLVMQQQPFI